MDLALSNLKLHTQSFVTEADSFPVVSLLLINNGRKARELRMGKEKVLSVISSSFPVSFVLAMPVSCNCMLCAQHGE